MRKIDPAKLSIHSKYVPASYGPYGMTPGTGTERFYVAHPNDTNEPGAGQVLTTGEHYATVGTAAMAAARWAASYDPHLIAMRRQLDTATKAYVERVSEEILGRYQGTAPTAS